MARAGTRSRQVAHLRSHAAAMLALVFTALAVAPTASAAPRLGATAEIRPVRGVVLLSKPGEQTTTRVRGTRRIRLGSVVDATNGVVDVTTARNRRGGTQTGRFKDGAFEVTQSRGSRPYTILDLTKGDESGCAAPARVGVLNPAGSRRTRRLWGRARGRFRTRGRSATATIRGTTWTTEDTCETTRVGAVEGTVELASGTQEITVEEGEVSDFFCDEDGFAGPPGDIRRYCQVLGYELPRSRTRRGVDGPLGNLHFTLFFVANTVPVPSTATVCIRNLRSGGERCTDYPFVDNCELYAPREGCQLTARATDICDAPRSTEYAVRWRIGDIDLPVVQSGRTATRDPNWDDLFDPNKPCSFSSNDPLPRPLLR